MDEGDGRPDELRILLICRPCPETCSVVGDSGRGIPAEIDDDDDGFEECGTARGRPDEGEKPTSSIACNSQAAEGSSRRKLSRYAVSQQTDRQTDRQREREREKTHRAARE